MGNNGNRSSTSGESMGNYRRSGLRPARMPRHTRTHYMTGFRDEASREVPVGGFTFPSFPAILGCVPRTTTTGDRLSEEQLERLGAAVIDARVRKGYYTVEALEAAIAGKQPEDKAARVSRPTLKKIENGQPVEIAKMVIVQQYIGWEGTEWLDKARAGPPSHPGSDAIDDPDENYMRAVNGHPRLKTWMRKVLIQHFLSLLGENERLREEIEDDPISRIQADPPEQPAGDGSARATMNKTTAGMT